MMSPLGIASAVATTILAPLTVWLVQSTFKSLKRANALAVKFIEHKKDVEVRLCDVRKDVDTLRDSSKTADVRIVRVEDAIVDIRAAVQRSDEQFSAIMSELKEIPRISTMMQSFQVAISSIVPRAEVESKVAAIEHRVGLVEQDVRGKQ